MNKMVTYTWSVHFFTSCGGVRVCLICTPLFGPLYQHQIMDECGAVGGIRIGRENELLGENLP
jgi:hypothetical protein